MDNSLKEKQVCNRFVGPGNWVTLEDLSTLHEYGSKSALKNSAWTFRAAQLRVVRHDYPNLINNLSTLSFVFSEPNCTISTGRGNFPSLETIFEISTITTNCLA